ncbi:alpha-amylase family protein [Leadbetterella byssophila]|uniref:alpha-amylase family protein n=1 Tax=Leadbetterella byssophila TaxID=316068 RepID=UPI0039A29E9D
MDKIAVYQLFLRVFANKNTNNTIYGTLEQNGTGKFNDINEELLDALKSFGITHIWYTGVIEHATLVNSEDHPQIVKGIAGSPYAIKDYYDVNPYLAEDPSNRMGEFEALVRRTHAKGLKVLIDFVPNHVARQYRSDQKPEGVKDFGEDDDSTLAFHPQNNFYYLPNKPFVVPDGVQPPVAFLDPYTEFPARATGNDVFSEAPSINDWFETVKLNYGVDYLDGRKGYFDPIPDTWNKMLDILLFWAGKGVDGFRCDMAEMVPAEFWHFAINKVKEKYPQTIFIAEIYNPQLYRYFLDFGGFDYLYDKVGLYDALRRLIEGHGDAMDITRVWQRESGDFSSRMLRFLENHDEQRIASDFFAGNAEKAFPAMMLAATLHTGPVMIYGGQEFGVKPDGAEGFQGNDGRTTIFDFWGLPELQEWLKGGQSMERANVRHFYERMLHFIRDNEAVHSGHFHDLQYLNHYNTHQIYCYLRYTENQILLFAYNFGKEEEFEVQLPEYLLPSAQLMYMPVFHVGSIAEGGSKVKVYLGENSFKIWQVYAAE